MKDIIGFFQWHWRQWTASQRFYILGAAFFGAGIPDYWKTGETNLMLRLALGIWILVFLKWFMWDLSVDSWNRYKKEKYGIFDTIKESDK